MDTLKELDAGDIPQLIVFNKADKCDFWGENVLPIVKGRQIYMSAVNDVGMVELAELIKKTLYAGNRDCELLIPYSDAAVASYFMENATVLSSEYREKGVFLKVNCRRQDADKYQIYLCD